MWDLHGFGHKLMLLSFLLRLCPFMSNVKLSCIMLYVELMCVNLCAMVYLIVRHMDFLYGYEVIPCAMVYLFSMLHKVYLSLY